MTELLIIKLSSPGDIVQGLQVATSLKAQRSDLRISWVVREIFAPIVCALARRSTTSTCSSGAGGHEGVPAADARGPPNEV